MINPGKIPAGPHGPYRAAVVSPDEYEVIGPGLRPGEWTTDQQGVMHPGRFKPGMDVAESIARLLNRAFAAGVAAVVDTLEKAAKQCPEVSLVRNAATRAAGCPMPRKPAPKPAPAPNPPRPGPDPKAAPASPKRPRKRPRKPAAKKSRRR